MGFFDKIKDAFRGDSKDAAKAGDSVHTDSTFVPQATPHTVADQVPAEEIPATELPAEEAPTVETPTMDDPDSIHPGQNLTNPQA